MSTCSAVGVLRVVPEIQLPSWPFLLESAENCVQEENKRYWCHVVAFMDDDSIINCEFLAFNIKFDFAIFVESAEDHCHVLGDSVV